MKENMKERKNIFVYGGLEEDDYLRKKDEGHSRIQKRYITILVLQVVLTILSGYYVTKRGLMQLDQEVSIVVSLYLLCIIFLLMMTYSIVVGSSFTSQIKIRFLILLSALSFYLFFSLVSWLVEGFPELLHLNYAFDTLIFVLASFVAWFYWRFLRSWLDRKFVVCDLICFALLIIGIILYLGNLKWGYLFTISPQCIYERADTYFISLIGPIVTMLICMGVVICMKEMPTQDKVILLCFPFAPIIGTFITSLQNGPTLIGIEIFGSIMFVYCNLYVRKEKQLVEEKNKVIEQQNELTKSRIEVTKLQMNPHFIYNTLGSIAALCVEDPEQAEYMTEQFSTYLRDTFGQKSDHMMITFLEEIETLEHYINIEQIRYPHLVVNLNLKAWDFMVPGLSLQPLVENSINHGIRMKPGSGTIDVTSIETEDSYVITVKDDGAGFEGIPSDGRKHIGVANLKYRIETLCGGTFTLEGEKGVGTTAIIVIPKKGKEDNEWLRYV